MSYQFYVSARTPFGAGKVNELHNQAMPCKKAMVVISNGMSMKETGTLYRVLQELSHICNLRPGAVQSLMFYGDGGSVVCKRERMRFCCCPGQRKCHG